MKISTEAKVGAVTLVGLALLVYMVIYLGDFNFGGEKGYAIKAVFSQVNGLKEGSAVRYAGVDIGKVEGVHPADNGIEVRLRIYSGAKIPEGSTFSIGNDGLLGEKFVNITPPRTLAGYLGPNSVVRGEDPMDDLMTMTGKTLVEVQKLVDSLNYILGDDNVKQSLKASALNARDITERLSRFSEVLARMAENNEQDINVMVSNLRVMSGDLRSVVARVDKMVSEADNDGQTVKDLRETIQNLKTTSVRVEKIAASLEGIATDPDTAKNIKDTLRNAREVSEKANRLMTKVDAIKVQGDYETLYNGHTEKYRSDANLRINTSPNDFFVIGATDIGEKNKTNFQLGKGDEQFAGRAGIVSGKAGVGADAKVGPQLRLSMDVYDPNDVRVKLRAMYQLAPNTFLVGETDGVNKHPEQNTYVGLQRTF